MTKPGKPFAIEVENLKKKYEKLVALKGISFNVQQGEIFGFLGPNGAGKTTTINLLIGLAKPDGGRIRIQGLDCTKDPKIVQHLFGVVPDESNLYAELTGFENLCFCAAIYGMQKREREVKARELLRTFNLDDAADRKFSAYSKGMKHKLTIAAGIIHDPDILFLDEPTTGIDVASARQIRKLIAALHSTGKTIFLITHYIEKAERLCQRIAFSTNWPKLSMCFSRRVRLRISSAYMNSASWFRHVFTHCRLTPTRLAISPSVMPLITSSSAISFLSLNPSVFIT